MANTIEVIIKATDQASAVIDKVEANITTGAKGATDALNKLGEASKDSGDQADKGAKGFESFAGKLVAIQAGIGIAREAIGGLKQVWDFAKMGAENQRIADSFERTAKSIGGNAADIIAQLDKAARGAVDDEELMQASTRALTLGVAKSSEDLVNVMKLARGAALQFGGDAGTAFENINQAIGNLAPRALKQYGIIVDLTEANKKYADKIGVSADALTEQERRQALLNEVLIQGAKNFGDIGNAATTTGEQMKAIEVRLDNITDSVKEFIATGFTTAFTINDAPRMLLEAFNGTAAKLRKEVEAGRMSTKDYNDALQGMAGAMTAPGGITTALADEALQLQKLNDIQVIQMKIMGMAASSADILAKSIDGVALASKNAAAAVEANKPTDLSKLTPEKQAEATQAYKSYQTSLADIESKYDSERVKIVGDTMTAIKELEADSGKRRSEILSDFARKTADGLSAMQDKRVDILMGYSANEEKVIAQQNQERLKLARNYGVETERMEQEHQRSMERLSENHGRNLRKLADSRDALGIEDAQETYQIERRRAEEDYQVKAQQRSEDYARQLEEQNAANEEQRKARLAERDKQLADLAEQFKKQSAKEREARDRQLSDLDQATKERRAQFWADENQKIADLATAQAAERTAADTQWTQWRNEHEIFFAGERKLYDDYLKYTYDQLQAYITRGGPAPVAPKQVPIPGNYQGGADFVVPPGYPGDSFPMRVSSGERVQVTPRGQGGNLPAINITQNFSGAQSSPEQYRSIMYEVITNVFETAMRQ